jgi:hypothetical protein
VDRQGDRLGSSGLRLQLFRFFLQHACHAEPVPGARGWLVATAPSSTMWGLLKKSGRISSEN